MGASSTASKGRTIEQWAGAILLAIVVILLGFQVVAELVVIQRTTEASG